MDPFSIAVFTDGTIVRFHRSVERTVASIAEVDPVEACRYADWMHEAMPVVAAMRAGLDAGAGAARRLRRLPRSLLAAGGAQALTDALARRLASYGGTWRTHAAVARITRAADRVAGVVLESGEQLAADAVVTAIDPQTALLDLLDPPLAGPVADQLRAARRSNAVQLLVLLATCSLPPYPRARPGDCNGLQSFVDDTGSLAAGFARARQLPAGPVPTYAFTPSALDDTLAPPGRHTVYLACPTAPADLDGDWRAAAPGFADRMIGSVEARAPGFTATILDRVIRTPADMARGLRWPGAHPMHLDISLHQLGALRPTRALHTRATPVHGLVISGAGTAPAGGIAGVPGRSAAQALLRQRRH